MAFFSCDYLYNVFAVFFFWFRFSVFRFSVFSPSQTLSFRHFFLSLSRDPFLSL